MSERASEKRYIESLSLCGQVLEEHDGGEMGIDIYTPRMAFRGNLMGSGLRVILLCNISYSLCVCVCVCGRICRGVIFVRASEQCGPLCCC